MIYTPEEKRRMDRLMTAFADYIRNNEHFEILYSEKVGYITMDVYKGEAQAIGQEEDFDDLLDFIFRQISGDVIDLKLAGEHMNTNLYPVEVEETRRRAVAILNTLDEDREYCLESLEEFLEAESR